MNFYSVLLLDDKPKNSCIFINFMNKSFLIFLSLTLGANSYAWNLFRPTNYEECILENMKGTTNDLAAQSIIRACSDIYEKDDKPIKKCTTRNMTQKEMSLISANGGANNQMSPPYFRATIYNGNPTQSIEEVSVAISAENIKFPQEYTLYMSNPIKPKSSNTAGSSIQVIPGKNFQWYFTAIKTCEK